MFKLNLKTLREERGLSQKELSVMLGVSQGSVGNWEAGAREPKFPTLLHIASFFDVSTDYLLGHVNTSYHASEASTPYISKESHVQPDILSGMEDNHIKKYRRLSDSNRQAIDMTIDSMLIMQDKEKTG